MKRMLFHSVLLAATLGFLACTGGQSGENGSNGTDGKTTLVRVDAEPEGSNCARGGVAIRFGLDANTNGQLEDGEVNAASTQYVCRGASGENIHYGDVSVLTEQDLARLDGVEIIVGNLTLSHSFGGPLRLPSIRFIAGNLTVLGYPKPTPPTGNALERLEMPALEELSGKIDLLGGALVSLSLPVLKALPNSTLSVSSTGLKSLALPALERVSGVYIGENQELESVNVPALKYITGSASASQNPKLSRCEIARVNVQLFKAGWGNIRDDSGNMDATCDTAQVCASLPISGNSQQYRYCLTREDFNGARTVCQSIADSADLAVFNDASEFQDVTKALLSRPGYWVGYRETEEEGTWSWVTGVSGYQPGSSPPFWREARPADGSRLNCAFMGTEGRAYDLACTAKHPFLCELN